MLNLYTNVVFIFYLYILVLLGIPNQGSHYVVHFNVLKHIRQKDAALHFKYFHNFESPL